MLETLSAGIQYVAIIVLCASCWAAGRSVRNAQVQRLSIQTRFPADRPDPPIYASSLRQMRNRTFTRERARELQHSRAEMPDRFDEAVGNPDPLHQAFALRDLISTGDLSQEGVLEALVAMAEEEEAAVVTEPAERHGAPVMWRSTSAPGASPESEGEWTHADALSWLGPDRRVQRDVDCESPRILTRDASIEEPLPVDGDELVSPKVLARYRNYAAEYPANDRLHITDRPAMTQRDC